MKVLFIDEYLPQEMLGIMWLSRAIKDAGHECKALFIPDKQWLEKLKEYNPDVVCYSVTTGMHACIESPKSTSHPRFLMRDSQNSRWMARRSSSVSVEREAVASSHVISPSPSQTIDSPLSVGRKSLVRSHSAGTAKE